MSNPLVSVIVPVYNGERFVGQTIEAILAQDYEPVELIVVDDGSTDATADVVRAFDGVRYLRQDNAGPSVARNAGIAVAAGELLTFCDSDDVYRSGKVGAQVAYLHENPKTGCVLVKCDTFVEPGSEPPAWATKEQGAMRDPMVRREVLDRVGGFNAEYRLGEFMEWLGRLRSAGVAIHVLDEILVDRRLHGDNVSYRRADLQQGILRSLRERVKASRETGQGGAS